MKKFFWITSCFIVFLLGSFFGYDIYKYNQTKATLIELSKDVNKVLIAEKEPYTVLPVDVHDKEEYQIDDDGVIVEVNPNENKYKIYYLFTDTTFSFFSQTKTITMKFYCYMKD